MKLKQTNASAQ